MQKEDQDQARTGTKVLASLWMMDVMTVAMAMVVTMMTMLAMLGWKQTSWVRRRKGMLAPHL